MWWLDGDGEAVSGGCRGGAVGVTVAATVGRDSVSAPRLSLSNCLWFNHVSAVMSVSCQQSQKSAVRQVKGPHALTVLICAKLMSY